MNYEIILAEIYSIALDKANEYNYVFGDTKDRIDREFKEIYASEKLTDELIYLYKNNIQVSNESQSLILYLLGLTNEEPLGEFVGIVDITSDRIAPIDIDIDVSADRRGEVVDFVSSKMKAYPIMAFSTINKKSGIKDLGKAIGFPYSLTDALTKSIETGYSEELIKTVISKYPNFFNEVERLEGAIRHCTVHASGIAVFEGEPWDNFIALRKAPRKQEIVIDMDGSGLEKFGIMKFDILGSATTDIISETVKMAGKEIPNTEELINDEFVLMSFQECNVSGIFQAGGSTNKKVFELVKPQTFSEVADCISLARPGTKNQLEAYCNYKPIINNESVLKHLYSTRGILLYQEQVLSIAMDIGGLTGSEAEILRRGIGKKEDASYIEPVKNKFIENARTKIGNEAELLWDLIAEHVGYSFNKSHAVAYALQAFREMYLKLYAPLAFWCNMLKYCKEEEKYEYRNEIARNKIQLLLPSIKQTKNDYYIIEPNKIQLPIYAIKGFNSCNIEFSELNKIDNVTDAIKYLSNCFDKSQIESLITVGFFDAIDSNRELILNAHKNKGQLSMFDEGPSIKKINKYEVEKELFGFWVTTHPMEIFDGCDKISDVIQHGGNYVIGIVDSIRMATDKRGGKICFIDVSDETGYVPVIIFSSIVNKMSFIPYVGDIIELEGYINNGCFIANREPKIGRIN